MEKIDFRLDAGQARHGRRRNVAFAEGVSPMTRSFYAENKRVANRKLKEELRGDLAYPNYRAGLEALFEAGEGR
jgi:hypothetical protein